MRRRRKAKPDSARLHRCDRCGTSVPRIDFEAPDSAPTWRRCEPCTNSPSGDLVAAVLAHAGIEADSDDPATVLALRRVPWRARGVEAARARIAAEGKVSTSSLFPAVVLERQIEDAMLDSETVGKPSTAWAHLDPRAIRSALTEARAELARAAALKTCTEGVCGCCGARTSVTWHGPITFGSQGGLTSERPPRWPVCSTCWELLESVPGGDPTSQRARRTWTAVVLGKPASPPMMSIPPSVQPYALWVQPGTAPTSAPGVDVGWSWVSPADLDRLAQLAPQHRPAEVLEREERARAAQARLRAVEAATRPRSALVDGDAL